MRRRISKNPISRLFRGLGYTFEALGFINRERLWGAAFIPILVNVALLVALYVVMLFAVRPLLGNLDVRLTAWAGDSGLWQGLVSALTVVLWIIAVPLLLALSSLLLMLVGQAVASPFLDTLSEKVECRVLGIEPYPLSAKRTLQSIAVAVSDVVWGLCFWLVVNVPLLLLSFIPLVGSVVGTVVSFCFTSLLLAHQFVGLPLSRHLVRYRARWRTVSSNKMVSFGFGVGAMVVMFVPLLNLVLLPLTTVGGTLLYCDLKMAGRIPTALPERPASAVAA